jgi:hypothetical protein
MIAHAFFGLIDLNMAKEIEETLLREHLLSGAVGK